MQQFCGRDLVTSIGGFKIENGMQKNDGLNSQWLAMLSVAEDFTEINEIQADVERLLWNCQIRKNAKCLMHESGKTQK